jgi:glycine/D-amino acid oxidase-like deaminating enzyme
MIKHADVIVIGSGALGAETAFYLVKRGARNVALVDKHDIGSQTSPRAAGMVNCVRKSDLMIELIKLAVERIRRFTVDMSTLGEKFQIEDMALDPKVLWRYARDVEPQLPVLLKARVREHRGGIPTADGDHIVGPTPAARGFFFASGCNVAGLSISPALGDALAAWILEGVPPMDLTPLSPARFASGPWSEEDLRQQARWQYRHSYGSV